MDSHICARGSARTQMDRPGLRGNRPRALPDKPTGKVYPPSWPTAG